MNIFVDGKCTKIVGRKNDAIPIKITTDIRLFDLCEIDGYRHITNKDNELLYSDDEGVLYTEDYLYNKGEYIDDYTVLDVEMESDEKIYIGESIKLKPLTEKMGIFKYTNLTDDNAHLFELNDILTSEFSNIVENSNYNGILYYILTELNVSQSSFKSLNKLCATLGNNDYINIDITGLTTNINTIQLFNISDELSIYVNNTKIELNDNNELILSGMNTNQLSLEIRNENNYNISIINPYILYV